MRLPDATKITAHALLITLVNARASDMNRSMPTSSATPATGRSGITTSVATSATSPLPDTPAAPFDVTSITASSAAICGADSGTSHACAMNSAASVR
jgi:hypothetical protein